MTNVGISLHKQGQVLDHFIRTEKPKKKFPQGINEIVTKENNLNFSVTGNNNSKRTQELLDKKRRLQVILHELKLLAKAKQSLASFQPTLDLQEKILS